MIVGKNISKHEVNIRPNSEYKVTFNAIVPNSIICHIGLNFLTYELNGSKTLVKDHPVSDINISNGSGIYETTIKSGEFQEHKTTRCYLKSSPCEIDKTLYITLSGITCEQIGNANINHVRSKKKNIVFIMESFAGYSGGRYISYMTTLALQDLGFNVTIFTNIKKDILPYIVNNDFGHYKQPKIEYIENLYDLKLSGFDMYIGPSTDGGIVAHREAVKNKKPYVTIVFDIPTFMRKYGSEISPEWINHKSWKVWGETLKYASLILTFSNVIANSIYEFSVCDRNKVKIINPTVNSREIGDSVIKKSNQVFVINRKAESKRWKDISKINDDNIKLVVAASSGINNIKELFGDYKNVTFLENIPDREKFRLIKESAVTVNPSSYEGVSMVAAESLACETPHVCYDIESVRSTYGNKLIYAKYMDVNDLKEKVKDALIEMYNISYESYKYNFDNFKEEVFDVIHDIMPSDKMRIAIFNHGYKHYSGGVYAMDGFACALAEQGHDVTVVSKSENLSSFGLKYDNLKKTNSVSGTFDYVMSIHQDPMLEAYKFAKDIGAKFIPVIFELPNFIRKYIPETEWRIGNDKLWEYIREPLVGAHKILCMSNECARYIREFEPKVGDKDICVVDGVINDRAIVVGNNVTSKHIRLCWCGYDNNNKRFRDLLLAVEKMPERDKYIINYITPVPVPNIKSTNVNVYVSPSDSEKFNIINNSDIMVSTSKFEGGVQMSLLEALYMGKQCVSYPLPLHKELLGDLIYYSDDYTPESLAIAIHRIIIEDNVKGREFVRDRYTIESVGKSLSDILTYPKIGVYMGVLNEEKFIRYALEPFIRCKYIKKIVVTEACDKLYPGCSENGLSTDNTAEIVKDLMKRPGGEKIELVQMGFVNNKSEYQNKGLEMLYNCDWVIKADGDEVYKLADLYKIIENIRNSDDIDIIEVPQLEFWKYPNLIATGSLWGYKKRCIVKMKAGMRHGDCNAPPYSNAKIYDASKDDIYIYHYGAMKDRKDILDKLEYYRRRDEHKGGAIKVIDTWSQWKEGDGTIWTHTSEKSGVEKFQGVHPLNIRDFILETLYGKTSLMLDIGSIEYIDVKSEKGDKYGNTKCN